MTVCHDSVTRLPWTCWNLCMNNSLPAAMLRFKSCGGKGGAYRLARLYEVYANLLRDRSRQAAVCS